MGLFFSEAGAAARGKKKKPKRVIQIAAAAKAGVLSCSSCSLDKEVLQHPKMKPTGAERPVVYFMGEAPGQAEDEEGMQLVGRNGDMVRGRIPEQWERSVRWNNTVRCKPPGNREPSDIEVESCRRLQVQDIEQSKPKIIVAFGNSPLQWFLGSDRTISNWRGRRSPVKIGTHTAWLYPITDPSAVARGRNDQKKGEAIMATFERDLAAVFRDVEEGLPEPFVESNFTANIECLQEYGKDGLARIEERLSYFSEIEHANDIETNGLRPYSTEAKILTLSMGMYDDTFAFPWKHPEARWTAKEKEEIRDIIFAYLLGSGRKWAHSLRFEQEWYHKEFGPRVLYDTRWGDTLAQAHVLDERKGKGLDDLTQIHMGFRLKDQSDVDVANLIAEPLDKVLPYNGMDVKYTDALRDIQFDLLEKQGLVDCFEFITSATPALVRMQAKGVVRNIPAIIELDKKLTKEESRALDKISVDPDVKEYAAKFGKFLPTSNQDLVRFFRDFLKLKPAGRNGKQKKEQEGAKYSVDEEVLSEFKHPVAKMVLELRSVNKNHGYVTPLLDGGKFVHGDGLVHASYSNLVTVTGRLACEDPNQQNYPRREHKEIRRVVGRPPGCKLVAFDYGQLEARIVATVSGDRQLCVDFWDGIDIHGMWTDLIGAKFVPKKLAENRKKVRDSIKQMWTFALLYGNVLEAVAWDLSHELGRDISVRDLEPFYDDFWERYSSVHKWQDGIMSDYWKLGYVEGITGQRRRGPMNRNEIINHPIQGPAGHLVIDAQRRLSQVSYEEDVPALTPIMNVHDDLTFYFPEDSLEDLIEITAQHMVSTPFDWIKVPLTVEVSMGDDWASKEEVATFSTKDFQ